MKTWRNTWLISSGTIKDTGDWYACDSHYRFNSGEMGNTDDVMRDAGNSSFWKSDADGISAGPTPTETGVDLTKPPARRPRTIISYAAAVQKKSTKGKRFKTTSL
jgi:hypothetical protein